jgi:hypothetical protein
LKRDPGGWYRVNKMKAPDPLPRATSFPRALGRQQAVTGRMALSLAAAAVFAAGAFYVARR